MSVPQNVNSKPNIEDMEDEEHKNNLNSEKVGGHPKMSVVLSNGNVSQCF